MSNSPKIATPIVDRNGKSTTVHKNPEKNAGTQRTLPAPSVQKNGSHRSLKNAETIVEGLSEARAAANALQAALSKIDGALEADGIEDNIGSMDSIKGANNLVRRALAHEQNLWDNYRDARARY